MLESRLFTRRPPFHGWVDRPCCWAAVRRSARCDQRAGSADVEWQKIQERVPGSTSWSEKADITKRLPLSDVGMNLIAAPDNQLICFGMVRFS